MTDYLIKRVAGFTTRHVTQRASCVAIALAYDPSTDQQTTVPQQQAPVHHRTAA